MPSYEVHHVVQLTAAQRDRIAQAITAIHTSLFTTPAIFVHVNFHNEKDTFSYLGGKPRQSNVIKAFIRPGPTRTQEHFASLINQLQDTWNEVVGTSVTDEIKLRAVFIFGAIVAAYEGSIIHPQAGHDVQWFRENLPLMHEIALRDPDMKDMLDEVKTRKDFAQMFSAVEN